MVPFVSRSEWGAGPTTGALTPWPSGQPTGFTFHWEGAGGHTDHANCAAEVKMIQAFHQHNGYVDIAYNWIVCIHGVIFEGRPVGTFESAAQKGGNPYRIAVCFMWGPSFLISQAAEQAATNLYRQGPHHAIGHRDEPTCTTSCPGDDVERFVHQIQNTLPGPVPQVPVKPLPLPPAGVHHPVLTIGNVGPAVGELQRKLNAGTGTHLVVDGSFGLLTSQAVQDFQRFFKLQVDGVAGPKTWALVDYCAAMHGVR